MNLTEDIKPISYVKAHTAKIFQRIKSKDDPIVITQNGEAQAVLLNVNYYQKIKDTLNLLKLLSIGESDIKNKRIVRNEDLDKKVRDLLN
jgi:PHD/YefM family antitoxin component YafN of YafNO toxin-antitoxin module